MSKHKSAKWRNADSQERASIRESRKATQLQKMAEASSALKQRKQEVDYLEHLVRAGLSVKYAKLLHNKGLSYTAYFLLSQENRIREINTWEPKSKGRSALLISLADHLFSKYKTPPFLWNVIPDILDNQIAYYNYGGRRSGSVEDYMAEFKNRVDPTFFKVATEVASGASLYNMVKTNNFPVPFTRAMCHDFLNNSLPAHTFIESIRLAQFRSHGSTKLFIYWMPNNAATLKPPFQEEFWYQTMGWFVRSEAMLNPEQVGPMLDYIQSQLQLNQAYSLKGRTPISVIRSMEEWHNNLQKIRKIKGEIFIPSGYKGVPEFLDSNDCIWSMEELLTEKDLLAEGRALHHCVYSYASSIKRGAVSIWSMKFQGARSATVEVNHNERRITQARGSYNRRLESAESRFLTYWASMNNLGISNYV